ncbi:hydrolase [Bacteriophage Phi NF-1]|uniref:Hydrolase n=1 Tax=Bacteriophage Phi NF-1 TaxID=2900273 RepID=A0A976MFZ1_9CAUD|nr:hydrolase [Bacteriophage Phi NF-1]
MHTYTDTQKEIINNVKSRQADIDSSTWAGGDAFHSCRIFLEWAEAHAGEISPEAAREFFSPLDHHDRLDADLWELRGYFLSGKKPYYL